VQFRVFFEKELRFHDQQRSIEKDITMHKCMTTLTVIAVLFGTAFQGRLSPSVRGDLVVAAEQEYLADDSTEVDLHIEEAFISFLDLPGGLQAQVGRKLLAFGRLNPIHPHHWAFADTPLALNNLFGDHPWLDDGAEISYLVPTPADIDLKVSAGDEAVEDQHGRERLLPEFLAVLGRHDPELHAVSAFERRVGIVLGDQVRRPKSARKACVLPLSRQDHAVHSGSAQPRPPRAILMHCLIMRTGGRTCGEPREDESILASAPRLQSYPRILGRS